MVSALFIVSVAVERAVEYLPAMTQGHPLFSHVRTQNRPSMSSAMRRSIIKLRFGLVSLLLAVFLGEAVQAQLMPVKIDEVNAPRDGLLSNTVIDVVKHQGDIWLASGKGLSVSRDGGVTWIAINEADGLVSSNVSAIASIGSRLWVGTNNTGPIGDGIAIFSDGVSYSDDGGATWTQVNFTSTGQNIANVIGGNRTPFDLTGANDQLDQDYVFFAAFAGGLLGSKDGGTSWRRVFPSTTDSLQYVTEPVPSLVNRYFSCAIDTSHTDSVFLWAGTAGGLLQYIFASPKSKFSLSRTTAIARCADCGDSTRLFVGGTSGISVAKVTGAPFVTRTADDGLPANSTISAMIRFGGVLFAGTYNAANQVSTGLVRSDNDGTSFQLQVFPEFIGLGQVIREFAVIDHRLYAAFEAGICVSSDTGQTWSLLQVLPGDPNNGFNRAQSLASVDDTLYVGTDTGFVAMYLNNSGGVDSTTQISFAENTTSSRKVRRVRIQPYVEATVPKLAYWLSTSPATVTGTAQVIYSVDRGVNWNTKAAPVTNEILFKADSVILLTAIGARLTNRDPFTAVTALSIADSTISGLTLSNDSLLTGYVNGDTIIIGSHRGLAISPTAGRNYKVFRANTDPLRPDFVFNYIAGFGISGDFVPSIGVQYHQTGPASIWLSTRPVSGGDIAVNRLVFDTGRIVNIDTFVVDDFAWNFGFAGDTAYLACNTGLFQVVDTTIDTLSIYSTGGGDALVNPEATFFAVQPIDTNLWVGTDDGTLRYRLGGALPSNPALVAKVDLTSPVDDVYAFPVPFSPNRGGTVDFHFTVEQPGSVTLEIYDFAMNLVARPIDGVTYPAGSYPNGSQQGRTWDGTNGKGEVVAVGTYFVKVTVNDGDPRWGKLVVIP